MHHLLPTSRCPLFLTIWNLWTIGMGLRMGETGPSTRHKTRGCCHGDLSKDAVWGGTVRAVREGALIQIISAEKGEQWIRLCWSRIWTVCPGLSGRGKGALWEPHSHTDGGAGARLAQCHIEVVTLWLSYSFWLRTWLGNLASVLPGFPHQSSFTLPYRKEFQWNRWLFLRHHLIQTVVRWRRERGGHVQGPLHPLMCDYVQTCPLGPAGTSGKSVVSGNGFLWWFFLGRSYFIESVVYPMDCRGSLDVLTVGFEE